MNIYGLTNMKSGSSVRGIAGLLLSAEEQFCHNEDVCSQLWFFACAAKCLLPEFRVVGMGQHLTSLLCVVFTEKPAIETIVSSSWRKLTLIDSRLITKRITKCRIMATVAQTDDVTASHFNINIIIHKKIAY